MSSRRRPWLWLLLAAAAVAAWLALFRHQADTIECATGAVENC